MGLIKDYYDFHKPRKVLLIDFKGENLEVVKEELLKYVEEAGIKPGYCHPEGELIGLFNDYSVLYISKDTASFTTAVNNDYIMFRDLYPKVSLKTMYE